jgi:HK97 family phage major capsid protein
MSKRSWFVDGRRFHSVDELKQAEDKLLREALAAEGGLREKLQERWGEVMQTRLEAEDAVNGDRSAIRSRASNPANREAGASFHEQRIADDPGAFGEAREQGLRAIERMSSVLSAEAGDRLDDLVRRDRWGLDARYIDAVSDPDYERAFFKRVTRPDSAQFEMTPKEAEAMRRVAQVEEERAMSVGVTTAGGFGVPFALDPTIMLSSDGSVNPLRQLATVTQITTSEWRGITSAGVTASFDSEAQEVSDDTPTLAQPTISVNRADAFIPYSFEVGMDYPGFAQEIGKLFTDAKDQLEASAYTVGNGTPPNPQGVITGATNVYTTAGTAAFVVADVYGTQQALPPRFSPKASWLSSNTIANQIYRFVGGASTEPPLFNEDRNRLLAKPWFEASNVVSTTSTGSLFLLYGDIEAGFRIVDRIGMSIEVVQHLFATANQRPTGQRGLFAWWRTGSEVQNAAALRVTKAK